MATGKNVKIGKIRFPKPFHTKISDLVISEPETGEILVIIPRCEIVEKRTSFEKNKKKPAFGGILAFFSKRHRLEHQVTERHIVKIPFLATRQDAISYAKSELISNICKPFHSHEIQFHVNEVDVFSSALPEDWAKSNFFHLEKNKADSFTNLSVQYLPGKKRTEMVLTFQNRNQSVTTGPEFRMIRNHAPSEGLFCQFTTGQASLSTDFLSHFSPFFESFGNRCRFCGELQISCQGNVFQKREVQYELKNSLFTQVNVQNILADYVGFNIQGELEQLWIKSASFTNGTMNMIEGAVENGSGTIQRKGIMRIVKRLDLLMQPDLYDQGIDKPIEFGNCSFRFSFSPLGVVFDTVGNRPLLLLADHELHKPQRRIDYPELLASLSTANTATVPMTSQARALLQILPKNHPTDQNPVPVFSPENNVINSSEPEPTVTASPNQMNPWNRF